MAADREVEAIRVIAEALDHLDRAARQRVVRWLVDRYTRLAAAGADRTDGKDVPETEQSPALARRLGDLDSLYAGAKVTAQWERALITAYWLQEVQKHDDFDARTVNHAMRECGYPISNITREFTKLTSGGLVAQLPAGRRAGRRTFRLSRDGLRWCRRRLGEAEKQHA